MFNEIRQKNKRVGASMRFMASAFYKAMKDYRSLDLAEEAGRKSCLRIMTNLKDPFNRYADPNHFTTTACIIDQSLQNILLVQHKGLGLWVFPGGHCDGNSDTVAVARTEAFEEIGIKDLKNIPGIFDIAIYPYERKGEYHNDHDVAHLFIGKMNDKMSLSEREVDGAKWVPVSQFLSYNDRASHRRILRKIQRIKNMRGRNPNKEIVLNGWK